FFFFFSSRRRHTRFSRDWSSDVCSSDLDDGSVTLDDQCQALGRKAAFAQTLAGLPETLRSEAGIEKRLARFRIAEDFLADRDHRSEERRVGKEGRSWWAADHEKDSE